MPRERLLRGEELVEPQVARVGEAVGEVGDDARFEIARSHGVSFRERLGGCGQYSDDGTRRALLTSPAMIALRRSAPTLAALILALCLAACGDTTRPQATIALADCRLPKLPIAAQCGTLEVPENRDKPDGRKITLAVAVLPANTLQSARRSAVHSRWRTGPGGELPRAVRRGARPACARIATSSSSTSAARAARRRSSARRSSPTTALDADARSRSRAQGDAHARRSSPRKASTRRNTRPPRGSPISMRCARRSATRRSICGAARTARAPRWNTCAAYPARVRSVVLDGVARRR